MFFGADYYPEHWPRERLPVDVRLMKKLGLNVVRMGEFSWAKFEPSLGRYDFAWLDEAIDLLNQNGIKTVLGTPTATPPAWIIEENPDILPVDQQGRTRGFGGRHHDCQSNPVYHAHIHRLVREMAQHYRDNPGVIGWQTDNEYGNSHMDLCYCPHCQKNFQTWLAEKYGTIEGLNRAWGTAFWSQSYTHFGQIPAPRITPNGHNPSHMLDWKRFCSHVIVSFQQQQLDILREICPHHFQTHNFMGFYDKTDYFKLAEPLDFVSHDQYPLSFNPSRTLARPSAELAATLDLVRGMKQKSFWIMEQQAGPTGWGLIGQTPRPGQLRLWTVQAVAHGADTVVYFRWRTCLLGTEQYWHGILPHSGVPGRRYTEIQKTIGELAPVMAQCKGGLPPAETAILFSYDQNWAFEIQPHHPDLDYIRQVQKYHKALYDRNVPVNFIREEEDFSQYKLLIAPLLYLMTPALEEKLTAYVKNGGHLVLTMRTGVKDDTNLCMSHSALPGNLGQLLGIEILDYDCLRQGEMQVKLKDGSVHSCVKWCDIITPIKADVLGEYHMDYYSGEAAVTANTCDRGVAYYVGTEPEESLMAQLVGTFLVQAGIAQPLCGLALEAVLRQTDNGEFLFLLNHQNKEVSVKLPAGWQPCVTDAENGAMPPFGIGIYRRESACKSIFV